MSELKVKVINGAAAGVIGVASTFPLDLVKTNLQLHPTYYRGISDCFKQIFASGGVFAFYRGIGPNLLLISPEKAIKLSCNDIFRKKLLGDRKHLPLLFECLAGGGAGLCQVVVTTPMELLKIKGQSQAKGHHSSTSSKLPPPPGIAHHSTTMSTQNLASRSTSKAHAAKFHNESLPPKSSLVADAMSIARKDGIRGFYKGVGSTLLRDIPFSMVYFPLFAHLNHANLNADGTSKPLWSLVAGVGAGAFSAWLFTPFDYVKTKIQSPNAPKDITVKRAVVEIVKRQGLLGLFTGAMPRVMVVAPLFGVAQATYYVGLAERLLGTASWDKPTI